MDTELERIETDLLLEALFRRYGYDFRDYARASLERRIRQFLPDAGCASATELIPRLLRDPLFGSQLVRHFSIPVTEMFRDPPVYRELRRQVVPLLRTWPHFKIWHAGCASGEEVYSLAILLKEEGVYERATIYATDFNDQALEKAREGIFGIDRMQEASRNYQRSGGRGSLSEYYHARYDAAVMDAALRERILFSSHNLATDSAFGEMHLVLCRNVLIYFNPQLKNRALRLFTESLVHGGLLCLGTKEDLRFTEVSDGYETLDPAARLYKKRALG